MSAVRAARAGGGSPVRARVLAGGGTLLAAVPTAIVAFVLARAFDRRLDRAELAVAAAILVAALLLRILLVAAAGRVVRSALNDRAARLRLDVIENLPRIPLRTLHALDAGRTVALLTTGIDEAVGILGDAFDAVSGGVLTALVVFILLAAIDWRIALVALAFFPVTAIYWWQSRGISARAAPRLVRARAEGTSRFFEYVESVGLLRTFGRTTERASRLAWALSELKLKAFENAIAPIPFGVLALFFIEFGFAISVMVATEVDVGPTGFAAARFLLALIVALAYFQTLFDAADGLLRLRGAQATWAEVERLRERSAAAVAGPAALPTSADVVVDRVTFAFDRGPVLDELSCRFGARGVTALVGRSGAGKSALAGVIAGLHEPAAGKVVVGGVDLATLSSLERAQVVALVFQDTELLAGTVAENIAAGRPGASEAEIRAAARTALCDEFVSRLPAGYATVLRAGSPTLSLGERQRIAIARALLGAAPVVIFDECTASLDPGAERAVHAAIDALALRSTVLLITHRLGTVREVPRILVLAGGTIVESGTHDALAAAGGEYATLWDAYRAAHRWRPDAVAVASDGG